MKHILVVYLGSSDEQSFVADNLVAQLNEIANANIHAHAVCLSQLCANLGQWEHWVKDSMLKIDSLNSANPVKRWFYTQQLIRLHSLLAKSESVLNLTNAWQRLKPDMIVSLAPLFNGALKDSLKNYDKEIPLLVLPPTQGKSDLTKLWLEQRADIHYALNGLTQQSVVQEGGLMEGKVFQLSGVPLAINDDVLRLKYRYFNEWGFRSDWPTCFVSFGIRGSEKMLAIAKEAILQGTDANFIFHCGNNGNLVKKMKALQFHRPVKICKMDQTCPASYLLVSDFVLSDDRDSMIGQSALAEIPCLILSSNTKRRETDHPSVYRYNRVASMLKSVQVDLMHVERNPGAVQNKAMKELLNLCNKLIPSGTHQTGRVIKLNSKSVHAQVKATGTT